MTHIDHQINRFLEVLQEFGLSDDTYICFTSDHGEMMGDHHFFRKAYPYEGSARVPLILRGPPGSGVGRGQALDQVVELRDVMPTLLECAEVAIPESVEGRSFLPTARGEVVEWREYLHGEHTVLGQSAQWLTDGHEKYVWYSGTGLEQLFDLDADPTECRDLAALAERSDRVASWRAKLIGELAGREEGFVEDGRLVTGRPVDPVLSVARA
jgi:arylsulfatase A-like enzyme